eukprot:2845390-Amphidinium_carterae.1
MVLSQTVAAVRSDRCPDDLDLESSFKRLSSATRLQMSSFMGRLLFASCSLLFPFRSSSSCIRRLMLSHSPDGDIDEGFSDV